MLKQTTQLFLKALIIGILVNIGLQYATIDQAPPSRAETQYEHLEQSRSQENLPMGTDLDFAAPISDK